MISSQESNVCWVFKFQAQKELECFHWIISSVHKIAHEYVSCIRDVSSFVEELKKVMELTVDITTDSDRSTYWLYIAFFNE
jgi:hypothetical protein